MYLKAPVKQIMKFKVPGVLAIALLAGQLVVANLPERQNPNCSINVERPHTSTYLKERKNIDLLKLNITTRCDLPQKYTILNAEIEAIVDGVQSTAHIFSTELRTPKGRDRREVHFLNLKVDCQSKTPSMYLGKAQGEVHLQDGRIEKVKGDSVHFISEDCRIPAK